MISDTVQPLRIRRHIAQSILHEAIRHQPDACCGLLGGTTDTLITHSIRLPNTSPSKRQDLLSTLSQVTFPQGSEKTLCLGSFHCTSSNKTPDITWMRETEAMIRQQLPHHEQLIHLLIAADTAGRIETFAFRLQAEHVESVALEILEDGHI